MTSEADDLDRAADLTQQLNDMALADVRGKARPQQTQNADGTWPSPYCVECEEEIPLARLNLGRIRCIDCQQVLERRR